MNTKVWQWFKSLINKKYIEPTLCNVLYLNYRNVTAGSQLSKTEQELAEREDSLRDMSNRLDRLYKDWQDIYNDLQPETRTADELQALHDRIKEMTRRMNEYKQLLENRIANDIPIRESQAAIYKNEAEDIARRVWLSKQWSCFFLVFYRTKAIDAFKGKKALTSSQITRKIWSYWLYAADRINVSVC